MKKHLLDKRLMDTVIHPWEPIINSESRILILGTIPSPKSRENAFYYGHPQNIFWLTLAKVLGINPPENNPNSKTKFLLDNHVAIWDVLHSCEIDGAKDDSIINPTPNTFKPLIEESKISTIFTTGKKATALFNKLCADEAGMQSIYLPSTSPANRMQQGKPEFYVLWNQVKEAITGF